MEPSWALGQVLLDGYDFEDDLATLTEAAVRCGVAQDSAAGRDRVSMRLMGSIMARPSEVSRRFWSIARSEGAISATDWFYRLCCDVDYVLKSAIARNLKW